MEVGRFISKSRRYFFAFAAAAAYLAAACAAGVAAPIEPFETAANPFWTIDEVRAGAFRQAIDDSHGEGTGALNLEVLGGRFAGGYEDSILDFLLTPRPHIGTTIAFGKTDEFYFGVTWDAKLIGSSFFEASFGGAVHDGPLHDLHEASYGCQVNFRESASLGYALTSQLRVMATLDHMSNAGLCGSNRGLTNAGVRLGIKF